MLNNIKKIMAKRYFKINIVVIILFICTHCYAEKPQPPIVMAIHPYLNADDLKNRFTPLANYIGKAINREILVKVGRTYDEHLQAICHDEVDIAFIGPAPYIKLMSRNQNKHLLAKFSMQAQEGYYGHIVTRQDSKIKSLSDLIGKSFAFGDPNSTMSHLVPLYMLQEAAIIKEELGHSQFLYAHRNVAHAVLAGDFDAGAIKHEVFQEFSTKGLRELARTPMIPSHLFIAGKHVPDELISIIKEAMFSIDQDPYGLYALKSIHKQLQALVPVKDSDYDQLRHILNQISSYQDI